MKKGIINRKQMYCTLLQFVHNIIYIIPRHSYILMNRQQKHLETSQLSHTRSPFCKLKSSTLQPSQAALRPPSHCDHTFSSSSFFSSLIWLSSYLCQFVTPPIPITTQPTCGRHVTPTMGLPGGMTWCSRFFIFLSRLQLSAGTDQSC